MPRLAKALTDIKIRGTKPRKNEVRLYDGDGLYLSIMPTGARWWRLKYHFAGKEKRIGLGTYPEVSLSDARERREQARTSAMVLTPDCTSAMPVMPLTRQRTTRSPRLLASGSLARLAKEERQS